MARERMVTRTIEKTTFTVMVVNVKTAQVSNVKLTLGNVEGLSDSQIAKKLQEILISDEKLVQIVSRETTEELFGMSEVEFIANAVRLDPETRKPLAQ